jgi:hypothetical protein
MKTDRFSTDFLIHERGSRVWSSSEREEYQTLESRNAKTKIISFPVPNPQRQRS